MALPPPPCCCSSRAAFACPFAALPRALAPPCHSARRAARRHRWPTLPPAEAARRAAGHGPVPWLS